MASLNVRKFPNTEEASLFMKGGVTGGKIQPKLYVNTLTLIFNQPAAVTVTFNATGSLQEPLSWPDIVSAIETQTTNAVKVLNLNGYMALVEASPANGIDVDKTGTANTLLGFSTQVDTVGTFYNPYDGVAPRVLSLGGSDVSNAILVLVEE